MIPFLLCLCVPLTLFAWGLCAIAGEADDRMEEMFQKTMQEKEHASNAVGDDLSAEENAYVG